MNQYQVLFDELEWQDGIHGARFKIHREGNKQIRVLEFTSEFVEPEWCKKEHIGFVIKGELEIDFHGRIVKYPEGSGLFIPAGLASAHKARSVTPTVLLFLVEDI
jgi:quercetin dioxygenase-like cupin family protein